MKCAWWCRSITDGPGKKVTTKQLPAEPFIIREHGSGNLQSIQTSFSEVEWRIPDWKVVARIGNTEAIRQAIKNGN